MAIPSTITYDPVGRDYLINGMPLLAHLGKHEQVEVSEYMPALIAQPGAAERLAGQAAPDLHGQHVAVYLCGRCGGYDGNPIGIRIEFHETTVQWSEMGYYSDCEGGVSIPFARVTGYTFDRSAYEAFLASAKRHGIVG